MYLFLYLYDTDIFMALALEYNKKLSVDYHEIL